jgi:CHAT domain-containing protein
VRPSLGEEADKERIQQGRSPRVLHLATSSFFLPDRQRSRESAGGASALWQNPLHRSGLMLARQEELSALEITGMDLVHTELVVMSACQTPAEESMSWPNVSGLLGAWVHAGAQRVVLSLWHPPEAARSELILAFYRYLQEGRPVAESLRQARLEMRSRHPEPLFWAGWVCLGDVPVSQEAGEPGG